MNQFDVIIVGGGIVGLTAACALGGEGVAVAVVEAREVDAGEIYTGRNPRVFAINRASQRILSALGVWNDISSHDVYPFREMQVWDAGGAGTIHFDCADIGEPYLGHMIEPRIIQAALLRRVASITPVSLFCPAQLRDINITDMEARVDLDQGAALTAELVVAADGTRSRVRERLGIKTRDHDYRQSGLVALVKTEHPHKATAWQRFLPGGPLAFLPMKDGWSSIVWTLPDTEVETVLGLDKDAFHEALGQAFDFRLGRIVDSEQRAVYPLRRMHAEHYVRKRVALIGDAAHAIHPLAGQGVNLGLLDAAALAEVILAARAQGKHPGNLPVLRRYERWRRGENQIMMSAMDGFNRLFSNRQTPLRQIRNLGLTLMDVAGPAKNLLVRHAMGLAGDMPALATKNIHSPCID